MSSAIELSCITVFGSWEKILEKELPVIKIVNRGPNSKLPSEIEPSLVIKSSPLIFGVDISNENRAYVIAGDSMFWMARLPRESVPSVPWLDSLELFARYQLTKVRSPKIPKGYFVHFNVPQETVARVQSRFSALVDNQEVREYADELEVLKEFRSLFARESGIDFACGNKTCRHKAEFLRKSIVHGFIDEQGKEIAHDYYVLDTESLSQTYAKETLRMRLRKVSSAATGAALLLGAPTLVWAILNGMNL